MSTNRLNNTQVRFDKKHYDYVIVKLSRKLGQKPNPGDIEFFTNYWMPFAWACTLGLVYEKKISLKLLVNLKILVIKQI